MTSRPIHLAEPGSFTGNTCRTPWDSMTFLAPDPVTTDLGAVTCRRCRDRMIKDGRCPNCGGWRLEWNVAPQKTTGVADGRLTIRDVVTVFYLGCSECSETLIPTVDAETVALHLTHQRWTPEEGR